eukprot:TRINITY_DN112926_c0_g1_i1.p1 TRINITY_DN112926_c0_g1~~TRINITY_DN112926_c0_g1_i1.p1  ORF type:complete len:188 (-),score=43.11 TRINITY_DN112926_c0_g1_i1:63-626(-)
MPNPVATFETSEGTIVGEIFLDRVPRSASNFIDLARSGFYDGLHFHRVIPDFSLEFGCPNSKDPFSRSVGTGGPAAGPSFKNLQSGEGEKRSSAGYVQDEFISKDSNAPGTLAVARAGSPDTGGSRFIINVADNSFLDWFAPGPDRHLVFGKVRIGYDVVVRISKAETQATLPVKPVKMLSVQITGL